MDRKDELISNLVGDIIEACGDNEQDIYLSLKAKGFTLDEMRTYWEECPIQEYPYEVWCLYYNEDGTITDGDLFLGAYKNVETAIQLVDALKEFCKGANDEASYMVAQVELVALDDEGNSNAIDIVHEGEALYNN